jgi:hypothetical protein
MFTAEDFEVPLEKQLKMRLVYDDIDKCTDVKALQENLKACADQLMKYQHLLSITLQKQLEQELTKLLEEGKQETS